MTLISTSRQAARALITLTLKQTRICSGALLSLPLACEGLRFSCLRSIRRKNIGSEESLTLELLCASTPALAPFKACVLPLSKAQRAGRRAYAELSKHFLVDYDGAGSIGKRYRRQDEIGTPFCITYDFDSVEGRAVTVKTQIQWSRSVSRSTSW